MQSPVVNARPASVPRETKVPRVHVQAAKRSEVRVPRSAALRPEEFLDIVAKGRRR